MRHRPNVFLGASTPVEMSRGGGTERLEVHWKDSGQESVTQQDRLDSLEGLGRGRQSDVRSLKLLLRGGQAAHRVGRPSALTRIGSSLGELTCERLIKRETEIIHVWTPY